MITKQAAEMIDYVGGATGKLPAQNLNLNLDAVDFQDEMRGNFKHIGVYPTVIRERYNITDQVRVAHGMTDGRALTRHDDFARSVWVRGF